MPPLFISSLRRKLDYSTGALVRTEKTFSEVDTSCKSFLRGINMLVAEYDYDTDIAVQRDESLRIGIQQGIQQGFADGSYQKALETAKAFKRLGFDIAKIAEGTGLSVEEIKAL